MFDKLKGLFSKSSDGHKPDVMEEVPDGSVRIEGKTYALKRWSRHTFVASPCGPHFNAGDEVSIDVTARLGNDSLAFSGLAVVISANTEKDQIECRFLDIERAAQSALDRHFRALETAPNP